MQSLCDYFWLFVSSFDINENLFLVWKKIARRHALKAWAEVDLEVVCIAQVSFLTT